MSLVNKCLLIKMAHGSDFGESQVCILLSTDYYIVFTSFNAFQESNYSENLVKGYYSNEPELNNYCLKKIEEYFSDEDNTITTKYSSGLYSCSHIDIDKICFDYNFKDEMEKYKGENYFYIDSIVKYFAFLIPSDILPTWFKEEAEKFLSLKETLEKEMNDGDLNKDYSLNKKVLLGVYPQSLLKDKKIIEELNNASSNMEWRIIEKNGPFIKDFECGGKKYRALKYEKEQFKNDRNYNINESLFVKNGYEAGRVYYFEYSPIVWSVFKKENKYVLISDFVLDATSNDLLDKYLNDEFKNMSSLNSNINAQVMTVAEVNDFLPKKVLRKPMATEYAMGDGFALEWDRNSWCDPFVWLKDFAENNEYTNRKCSIALDGSLIVGMMENYGYISMPIGGVRPIVYLDGNIDELLDGQDQIEINNHINSIINDDNIRQNKKNLELFIIEDGVLKECLDKDIKEANIPNNITSIGDYAFYDCKLLTSVKIPKSVTSIGDCAFACCESLVNIEIPSNVTSIGVNSFTECKALVSINLPSSVKYIGDAAFCSCHSLKSIKIPDGVACIYWSTFSGCKALTSIVIPDSVEYIEEGAFSGCESLTEIIANDNIKEEILKQLKDDEDFPF